MSLPSARLALVAFIAALAALVSACDPSPSATPRVECPTEPPTSVSAQATLQDAERATVIVGGAVDGEFVIDLHGEQAPIATANFVALARCGFYDGIGFHRVIAGFVIQAGDPGTKGRTGDFPELGKGGPGYGFEIEPPAEGLRHEPYSVAMANNTVASGSQFFIALADLDQSLRQSGVYTIFGQVVSGTETVDAIAAVPVDDPRVGVPLDWVIIETITISGDATESPEA